MTNLKKLESFLAAANLVRLREVITLAEAVELIGKANRESAVLSKHCLTIRAWSGHPEMLDHRVTHMAIVPTLRNRYVLQVWYSWGNNDGPTAGSSCGRFVVTPYGLAKMVLEYKVGLAREAARLINPFAADMPLGQLADWLRGHNREHDAHADALQEAYVPILARLARVAAAAIDPDTCGMFPGYLADWMRDREHDAHADALEDYARLCEKVV